MGLWLYICQGRAWAFSAIAVNGYAVCAGSNRAGMVCAPATRAFLDLVLDFVYRRDLAIWAYFFRFGADGGNASGLLVQSEVIFGVIIAAILLGERPSLRQILGIVMASCGVVVILGAPALAGQWLGIGLVLSGALVWAFGQVLIRRLDGALGGFQLTAWIGVMAGPQMLLASCLIDGNPLPAIQAAPIEAWLTVIYLGVVMTAIGYSAWYYVLARYPVPMVMPVLLLLPVAAIFGAVTMLGEVPDPMVLAGGMVVIFGVGVVVVEPAYLLAWWRKKTG